MMRRLIPGVPPWPIDPDARSGSSGAAGALLAALGRPRPADEIHVLSGAALRWAHADDDGFDPALDPSGPDPVERGLAAAGVRGSWLLDLPLEEVRRLVSESLAAGRPALAAALPGYPAGGLQAICGEDDRGTWLVQGTFAMGPREWNEGSAYWPCPIPDPWESRVPGSTEPSGCPVFLVREVGPEPPRAEPLRSALGSAQTERERGRAGGTAFGAAAWEALIEDLLLGRRFVEGDRVRRIDAALGGLAHDRRHAATFLARVAADPGTWGLDAARAGRLGIAAGRLGEVADGVARLRRRVLDRAPGTTEPDALASEVENGETLVVAAWRLPAAALAALRDDGLEIAETPWGPAVVADSPARRGAAARIAAALRDQDAEAFEEIAAAIA